MNAAKQTTLANLSFFSAAMTSFFESSSATSSRIVLIILSTSPRSPLSGLYSPIPWRLNHSIRAFPSKKKLSCLIALALKVSKPILLPHTQLNESLVGSQAKKEEGKALSLCLSISSQSSFSPLYLKYVMIQKILFRINYMVYKYCW